MPSVSGLIVPFGVPVYRGFWYARYQPGSVTVEDVTHVPFAFEHLRTLEVIGVMTDVDEITSGRLQPGVWGTFDLDDSATADRAAVEFAGSRTGLSMGIEYDDETIDAIWDVLWDDDVDGIVDAAGIIREVSQVALPAFDQSRGQLQQQAV